MSEYKIEIDKELAQPFFTEVRSIIVKKYASLDEAIDAIKTAGYMNVPFLEDAIKWRSSADKSKLSIEIKEWPIYANTPFYQVGKIKVVD